MYLHVASLYCIHMTLIYFSNKIWIISSQCLFIIFWSESHLSDIKKEVKKVKAIVCSWVKVLILTTVNRFLTANEHTCIHGTQTGTSSLQSLTNCFSVVVTFSISNPLIGWLAGSLGALISKMATRISNQPSLLHIHAHVIHDVEIRHFHNKVRES